MAHLEDADLITWCLSKANQNKDESPFEDVQIKETRFDGKNDFSTTNHYNTLPNADAFLQKP
jgi:hypothetical protein